MSGQVKWPQSVRDVLVPDAQSRTQPVSGEHLLHLLRDMLVNAHDCPMPAYHDQQTWGRLYPQSGLVWFGKKAKLLVGTDADGERDAAIDEGPKRRRRTGKNGPETAPQPEEEASCATSFNLGVAGRPYALAAEADSLKYFDELLAACPGDLVWPSEADEVRGFLDAVGTAAGKALKLARSANAIKCLTRKMLLLMPESIADAFADQLTLKEGQAFTPDEKEHLTVACQDLTGNDLRRTFGMDLFAISCWVCVLNSLAPGQLDALGKATPKDLFRLALGRSVSEDELVAPMPESIANALLDES